VPAIILIGVYGVTEHCAWSISTLNLQKPLTVVVGRGSLLYYYDNLGIYYNCVFCYWYCTNIYMVV